MPPRPPFSPRTYQLAQEKKIQLFLDGQPAGLLFAKSTFLPAGRLSFVCEAGRGLRETSAAGRMDPYVIFKADGQVRKSLVKATSPPRLLRAARKDALKRSVAYRRAWIAGELQSLDRGMWRVV